WSFLSHSNPSLLESTIPFDQKRRITLSLLARFTHYPALLPLYSASNNDRPLVHLSGSYLPNTRNGKEFKFFEKDMILNSRESRKVGMEWDEVMWDFSIPTEWKDSPSEVRISIVSNAFC